MRKSIKQYVVACLPLVLASGCAHLPSTGPSTPINHAGRFWGIGISDGYHECDQSRNHHGQPCGTFGCATPACNMNAGCNVYQVTSIAPPSTGPGPVTPPPMVAPPQMNPVMPEQPLSEPPPPPTSIDPWVSPSIEPTEPPRVRERRNESLLVPEEPSSPSDRVAPSKNNSEWMELEREEVPGRKTDGTPDQSLPEPKREEEPKKEEDDDDLLISGRYPARYSTPSQQQPFHMTGFARGPMLPQLPLQMIPQQPTFQQVPMQQPYVVQQQFIPQQPQYLPQQYMPQQQIPQQQVLAQQQFAPQQFVPQPTNPGMQTPNNTVPPIGQGSWLTRYRQSKSFSPAPPVAGYSYPTMMASPTQPSTIRQSIR